MRRLHNSADPLGRTLFCKVSPHARDGSYTDLTFSEEAQPEDRIAGSQAFVVVVLGAEMSRNRLAVATIGSSPATRNAGP
jgi:hypothetical protein